MTKPCKHKFQPRYDKKWTTVLKEITAKGYDVQSARGAIPYLKEETYVFDICVRCGVTIVRKR